jgi:hypothetical protein
MEGERAGKNPSAASHKNHGHSATHTVGGMANLGCSHKCGKTLPIEGGLGPPDRKNGLLYNYFEMAFYYFFFFILFFYFIFIFFPGHEKPVPNGKMDPKTRRKTDRQTFFLISSGRRKMHFLLGFIMHSFSSPPHSQHRHGPAGGVVFSPPKLVVGLMGGGGRRADRVTLTFETAKMFSPA